MLILIADDESIIRLGLKKVLKNMGHEVLAATNGREAIQIAHRHQPDLAILDINMPFTDGLEAAKTLSRKQPLPIILLTAYSEGDLIEKATNLPIHGYLVKPVEPADLTAAIAVACKRFAETQALIQQTETLKEDLETRKLVERAKSKLMADGLNEEEAYRTLQRVARDKQKTLREIAQIVLRK